ncbi:MAG: hypothetical protein ACKOPS_09640, partial [Cyanobium sp.]
MARVIGSDSRRAWLPASTSTPRAAVPYVVARENLGTGPSLLGAAALLVDSTLTAAVSLMADTQALSSLWPALLPYAVRLARLV